MKQLLYIFILTVFTNNFYVNSQVINYIKIQYDSLDQGIPIPWLSFENDHSNADTVANLNIYKAIFNEDITTPFDNPTEWDIDYFENPRIMDVQFIYTNDTICSVWYEVEFCGARCYPENYYFVLNTQTGELYTLSYLISYKGYRMLQDSVLTKVNKDLSDAVVMVKEDMKNAGFKYSEKRATSLKPFKNPEEGLYYEAIGNYEAYKEAMNGRSLFDFTLTDSLLIIYLGSCEMSSPDMDVLGPIYYEGDLSYWRIFFDYTEKKEEW